MFGGNVSNKISFTLSNQRYYSTDNKILEDIGVPVEIEIKNTKQDIENKNDPVIIKAIEKSDWREEKINTLHADLHFRFIGVFFL